MNKIILALMLIVGIECLSANEIDLYDIREVFQERLDYKQFDPDDKDLLIIEEIDAILDRVKKGEINVKVLSYVKHYKIDGLNEGFKNSAKGIEYIHYLDNNHGIGLSYITFKNGFNVRTEAGGFVYKYTSSNDYFGIRPNIKLYGLYQKGYYGSWNSLKPYGIDNKFWLPLISGGLEYKCFVVDIIGTQDTLHAITFGYSFKL